MGRGLRPTPVATGEEFRKRSSSVKSMSFSRGSFGSFGSFFPVDMDMGKGDDAKGDAVHAFAIAIAQPTLIMDLPRRSAHDLHQNG